MPQPSFVRAPGVIAASVDGDIILMAPVDGRCYALGGAAGAVWELLGASRSLPELVDLLTARYDVDPLTCTQEVSLLLTEMRRAGVVGAYDQ